MERGRRVPVVPETSSWLAGTRAAGGGPVSGPRSALVEARARQVKADEERVGNGVTSISDRELCLRGAGRVDVTGDPEYAVQGPPPQAAAMRERAMYSYAVRERRHACEFRYEVDVERLAEQRHHHRQRA
ncbi:hypothetical protein MTO96_027177 [Rhipicephalus appendiculatus]